MTLEEDTEKIAQKFITKWRNHRSILNGVQKDDVGKSYLRNILGLNEEEIQGFIRGDLTINHRVGMIHAGIKEPPANYTRFWHNIASITNLHTAPETAWLAENADYMGVLSFMWNIDPILSEDSQIIKEIRINMHVY
jgi:hypothetical protein